MRKYVQFIAAMMISFTTAQAAFAAQNLDSVVAVVNNSAITQSELNTAISQAKKQLAASNNPNAISDAKLKTMVLQQLIDEKLQLELAERAKLTVTPEQVTQTIQHIAKGYGLTVSQLKEKLQQSGMSFSTYQKMIHKQLLMHDVQQSAVSGKVNVTPADIQAATQQYQAQMKSQHAYHLIDIVASTEQQAQKILLKLKAGDDIEKVAPNETKDLGWKTADALPSLFLQQLSHMQTGDIAGPIKAPNGYHIIKLIGMQGQSAPQLTQDQIKNMAYQMKFHQAVEDWMKTVRKTAYIKISP